MLPEPAATCENVVPPVTAKRRVPNNRIRVASNRITVASNRITVVSNRITVVSNRITVVYNHTTLVLTTKVPTPIIATLATLPLAPSAGTVNMEVRATLINRMINGRDLDLRIHTWNPRNVAAMEDPRDRQWVLTATAWAVPRLTTHTDIPWVLIRDTTIVVVAMVQDNLGVVLALLLPTKTGFARNVGTRTLQVARNAICVNAKLHAQNLAGPALLVATSTLPTAPIAT